MEASGGAPAGYAEAVMAGEGLGSDPADDAERTRASMRATNQCLATQARIGSLALFVSKFMHVAWAEPPAMHVSPQERNPGEAGPASGPIRM